MSKCFDCGQWEEPGHESACPARACEEAEEKALFIEHIPISVLCRVRVARMQGGRVVDEMVSGEVALYHPYDQLPSLVNRVIEQLEGQG
jgi:hypothetical protein